MITITKTPYNYAPSQNPMIWEFTSNNPDTLYFQIFIKEAGTNKIISKNKIYIPPGSNKSFIDIQKIIDNLTVTQIDNTPTILSNLKGTVSYYLEVEGIDSNGVISDAKITTTTYHSFNGKLNNFDLFNGIMNSHFMQKGYQNLFLSDKPTFSYLHYAQTEHLYFLADNSSNVTTITFFLNYKNGTSVTHMMDFTNPQNRLLHRINLSPRTLIDILGFNLNSIKNLSIYLSDDDGVQMSEMRQYHIINYSCKQTICNVNWINEFGGMSSNTFMSPKETKSVEKISYYGNGYLERENGVFSPFQRIINTSVNNSYNITSQVLNDAEFDAITNIINSRNVFVELSSGELYPIVLDNNSIEVLKKKYTKKHNRLNLNFTSNANLKLDLIVVPQEIVQQGFDYFLDFIL
ncbi:hypothetical protein [Sphingobacterium cellulitidis]|uniref:Uncharacterized protein n=1 Tax=Sphingobacterium cellulitidis TaxID=1768011 RepID=A0A8H9G1P6_9SPHI|nr:hypothetical protein [Sphingobacterium soli]MBA8985978.1 hypothetical protein [Sphingobacterium soli]GGE28172.1 hypothetical protein GCM10011516_27270 [Sphingobacterium soli]